MRKLIAAPIVAGLIAMAALAAPPAAHAATAGTPSTSDTTATFAISGGDLTISAQADNGSLGAYTPVNSPATTYTPGAGGTMDNTTGVAAMGTSNESGVSWDPTLDMALPAQVVAGTYSGTITHSVA